MEVGTRKSNGEEHQEIIIWGGGRWGRGLKFWPELRKGGRNSVFSSLLLDLAPRIQVKNIRYGLSQIDLEKESFVHCLYRKAYFPNKSFAEVRHLQITIHKLETSSTVPLCTMYSNTQMVNPKLSCIISSLKCKVTCDIFLKIKIFSNRNNMFIWQLSFRPIILLNTNSHPKFIW